MDKKIYDGSDEIIFSGVFNVYENNLLIKDIVGYDFNFLFEKKADVVSDKDINITEKDKKISIIFSSKIRNSLGSGTTNKIPVITFNNGKMLLCSIYSSAIGDGTDALSVVINFYLK